MTLTQVSTSVQRVERKLDRFIDVQMQANQLMDRRLRVLELRL